MREEYGFEIVIDELLDVVNHLIPAEKQHLGFTNVSLQNKKWNALYPRPRKCDEIAWFELAEFRRNFSPCIEEES